MLHIERKRTGSWKTAVLWLLVIIMLLAGTYILLVVFGPGTHAALLTGKPEGATAQKLTQPAGEYGDRLFIPSINVDVGIYTGGSDVLEKGAWHRQPQNGNPEDGGNFVLSAHRFVMSYTPQGTAVRSPFYNVGKLVVGDRLYVDYHDKRYEYKITKKYSVKPDALAIEDRTDEPRLTLYACTLQGSLDGRDVIEAVPTRVVTVLKNP